MNCTQIQSYLATLSGAGREGSDRKELGGRRKTCQYLSLMCDGGVCREVHYMLLQPQLTALSYAEFKGDRVACAVLVSVSL